MQKSVFSVTSLCRSWSFWETVLKFSFVIFWYIILCFHQYFPEFFIKLRLSFISFSVQVIPYCLDNIQVWTSPWLSVFYQLFFSPNMISLALVVCLGSLWYWKIKSFPIRHCWRNGMMGLFSSYPGFFSHVRRRVGERWNNECLQPWWGCISASAAGDTVWIDGIMNAEKYTQVLINYAILSGKCLIGIGLEVFQDHNDPIL